MILNSHEIYLIEKEKNSKRTIIVTKNDSVVIVENIGKIIDLLNNKIFFRSHKSYIINISKVKRLTPYNDSTYKIEFQDIKEEALITNENLKLLKFCLSNPEVCNV